MEAAAKAAELDAGGQSVASGGGGGDVNALPSRVAGAVATSILVSVRPAGLYVRPEVYVFLLYSAVPIILKYHITFWYIMLNYIILYYVQLRRYIYIYIYIYAMISALYRRLAWSFDFSELLRPGGLLRPETRGAQRQARPRAAALRLAVVRMHIIYICHPILYDMYLRRHVQHLSSVMHEKRRHYDLYLA